MMILNLFQQLLARTSNLILFPFSFLRSCLPTTLLILGYGNLFLNDKLVMFSLSGISIKENKI